MTCPACFGNGYTTPGIGIEVCEDCGGTGEIKIDVPMKEETTRPEANLFDARIALIIAFLAFLACFFVSGEARAQKIYTVYDYAHEAKFEIYDPITPKRLGIIADSLSGLYDSNWHTYGCRWIEQSFMLNLNGGYSDCSTRQIIIGKNPPNRKMLKTSGWFIDFSDTVGYCGNDLSSFEVEQFEKNGYVMIDTCLLGASSWFIGDTSSIMGESYKTTLISTDEIKNGAINADEIKNMPISKSEIDANAFGGGDITSSPTGFWMMYADTVGNGGAKKDTILVDVLCTLVGETPVVGFVPYVTAKMRERTLEWQTWPENNLPLLSYTTKSDWRVIETRWLESVEGCYQLIPLKDE